MKGRPWLLWWCWWLPAPETHPASKSPFWAVKLLLGTEGPLELSSRASQGQLTSPHCEVRCRTEGEASHLVKAFLFCGVLFSSIPSPPHEPPPIVSREFLLSVFTGRRAFNQAAITCLLQKSNCSLRIHHGQALGWRPRIQRFPLDGAHDLPGDADWTLPDSDT